VSARAMGSERELTVRCHVHERLVRLAGHPTSINPLNVDQHVRGHIPRADHERKWMSKHRHGERDRAHAEPNVASTPPVRCRRCRWLGGHRHVNGGCTAIQVQWSPAPGKGQAHETDRSVLRVYTATITDKSGCRSRFRLILGPAPIAANSVVDGSSWFWVIAMRAHVGAFRGTGTLKLIVGSRTTERTRHTVQ